MLYEASRCLAEAVFICRLAPVTNCTVCHQMVIRGVKLSGNIYTESSVVTISATTCRILIRERGEMTVKQKILCQG